MIDRIAAPMVGQLFVKADHWCGYIIAFDFYATFATHP